MVSAQVHISHLFIALQIQRTETFAAASWEVSQGGEYVNRPLPSHLSLIAV